ncbi:MAG TPA: SMP-30/gluconolactonase/LRE family protein [Bryobacteraceae bacterium]|nr:SMP-30/gluconolactonase/LRE family protein [Bryobacteraceae bacterium]
MTARLCSTLLFLAATPALLAHRPAGDSRVFAGAPSPGYPEGIAVRGNRVYVSGPATFGLQTAPYVAEYNLDSGKLLRTLPITIANPYVNMRAASCLAFGPDGKLYVIEPFVGVIRMNLDAANTQTVYATFPPSNNSLLNDLAFDKDGNLYVTDSFQGVIYKIRPGGGAAQMWFQDSRLLGNPQVPFGVNGIRIDKQGKRIYFSVTARQDFSGAIYSLPLVSRPQAWQLDEFHVFPATQANPLPGPDGIAFGHSGKLYVTLAGSSEISVLLPNGMEQRTFTGPAKIDGSGQTKPWTNPANIAFDDDNRRILVTNHASLAPYDPTLFFVFDMAINDKGEDLP